VKRLLAGLLPLCAALLMSPVQAQPVAIHAFGDQEVVPIRTRYLLVGPQGSAVTDEDFRGRFQLITFGYTACPDVCPTTLVELAEVLRLLGDGAARLQAIFITVDPARDTAQALATYTAFFDSRILGLGGTPELVQRAAANFKVRYAKVPSATGDEDFYAVDHSAGLYLVGPDGGFIKKYAYGTPAAQVAAEIHELLARG
jgi:cytochrome oxidase Cu insertion factor (SCO1/SenC/PrrC family)